MLKLATRKKQTFQNTISREQYSTPPRPTMTTEEAALFLGVCPRTLINLVKAGKIPYQRTGRKYVFSRAVLDKWVRGEIYK